MGILTFCEQCGALKVRDVKEELEKLLQTKDISPHKCGICLKLVPTDTVHEAKDKNSEKPSISAKEDETVDKQVENEDQKVQGNLDYDETSNIAGRQTRLSTGAIERRPVKQLDSEDDNESVDVPFDSILPHSSPEKRESNDSGITLSNKSKVERKRSSSGVKKNKKKRTRSSSEVEMKKVKCRNEKKIVEPDVQCKLSESQLKLMRALDPVLLPMLDMDGPPTKEYVCKECKKSFSRVQGFIAHTRHHTGKELTIQKPFMCPVCSFPATNLSILEGHMASHAQDKTFVCKVDGCTAKFASQRYLNKHMRRHQGFKQKSYKRKKYSCTMCDHKTVTLNELALHNNTHTNARPFKCSFCDKGFNDPMNKRKHEANKHNKEKRYMCELCGFLSYFSSDLVKHNRIHSGDKPFACDQCEYRSNRRDNLKKHLKVHGIMDMNGYWKCTPCGQVFYTLDLFKAHEKSHLQMKPLQSENFQVPVNVGTNSGHSENKPSQDEFSLFDSKPSQSDCNPGQGDSNLSQSDSNPSQSDSNPSQSDSNPSQSDTNPSQSGTKPVKGMVMSQLHRNVEANAYTSFPIANLPARGQTQNDEAQSEDMLLCQVLSNMRS